MVTAYLNGSTAGTPPGKNDHERAKRDVVKGWSAGAVRRHTKWLYSVDADALDEGHVGLALTLTMRDCPPDSDTFHRLRRAWLKRLERAGADRVHWVVEWQRRGVPHVHAAVYFPADDDRSDQLLAALCLTAWLAVADEYGALLGGQHFNVVDGPLGWLQYLSKHAARGAAHYQRQGHPEGWAKTGRLWGHTGEWPTIEPMRFSMSTAAFHRYRRLCRQWRIADARSEKDPAVRARREQYAKRMLACNDPRLSAVRGVSDWIPEAVTMELIGLLVDEGHEVIQQAGQDVE